eukprot:SAG31_NODE_550_length_14214_cov_3.054269_4_plen_101_part_00
MDAASNTARRSGWNMLCGCGSGRKFKKCCAHTTDPLTKLPRCTGDTSKALPVALPGIAGTPDRPRATYYFAERYVRAVTAVRCAAASASFSGGDGCCFAM